MNRIELRTAAILVLAAGLLAACGAPAPTPTPLPAPTATTRVYAPEPEPNFALFFSFGSCLGESVDTFQGAYTRDMCPPDPPVTAALVLTAEELRTIYRKMAEIDLFGYPDSFSIAVPEGAVVGYVTPSTRYYLKVRNGEIEKELSWTDDIVSPASQEADRLRALFGAIAGIIYGHPELRLVPTPTCACL